VELSDVEFTNTHYQIKYADRVIYITSAQYELAAMIKNSEKRIDIRFPLFYIRDYQSSFNGILHYSYSDRKITAEGNYSFPDMRGEFAIEMKRKKLQFHLKSEPFRDISKLIKVFPFGKKSKMWLGERVKASLYTLDYLRGNGYFDRGLFVMDPEKLEGGLTLEGPEVSFHNKLSPIRAKKARVHLYKKGLYFEFDSLAMARGRYQGARLPC
jgi:hypothetical protein